MKGWQKLILGCLFTIGIFSCSFKFNNPGFLWCLLFDLLLIDIF